MPNSWFNPHRHQFAAASASAVTDAFSRNQDALIADGLVSSQMRTLPLEVLDSVGYWRIGVVRGVIQALEEGLEVEAGLGFCGKLKSWSTDESIRTTLRLGLLLVIVWLAVFLPPAFLAGASAFFMG